MNILYMHTHDTGRYIEPYGFGVPTPHLMALAKESTLFRNAFCVGPSCSPSRAGLLTGMTAHSSGMLGLSHRGHKLNDYRQHMVQYLGKNGYETVLCGVQHEASDEAVIGYNKILHTDTYNLENFREWDLSNAKLAADYIKEGNGKPFFLSFGMVNTHRPYNEIDEDINPDYIIPPFPIVDNETNRQDMAAYHSSVRVVDNCVHIVLKAIEEAGIRDQTMIIFTTDHGIAFPRMKCNLYDAGIGVSLIIDFPGNAMKGKAIDAMVSQLDIFPTICALTGIEEPDWLQGESMVPLFSGQADHIRDNIFSEVNFHVKDEPMRCVRSKRYKYIKIYSDHGRYVHLGGDGGPSEQFLREHGGNDLRKDKEMLFDLYLDPVERVNRVNDVNYKSVYKEMVQALDEWMIETDDHLIDTCTKREE